MKRAALILAALAAILTAAAAPVRTATENFVTNKIAEAVAAIPAPDYSTNNAALVATIEAKAPTPDLSPFLRNDKHDIDVQIFGGVLSGFGFHADTGHNDNGWNQYTAHNGNALAQSLPSYIQSNPWGFLKLDGDNMLTVPTLTVGSRKGTAGEQSVAEGELCQASGRNSHAEGYESIALFDNSHAEGRGTITSNEAEHAEGFYNLTHTGNNLGDCTQHTIGVGDNDEHRKNAVEVMYDGKAFLLGVGGYDGTNPTGEPNAATDLAAVINGLAPLASPAFTGTPTAPTPDATDNSTNVATTAFVKTAISGISVTPLAGRTFDFATAQGVMDALKATIEALGGAVTNAPEASAQTTQQAQQGE